MDDLDAMEKAARDLVAEPAQVDDPELLALLAIAAPWTATGETPSDYLARLEKEAGPDPA